MSAITSTLPMRSAAVPVPAKALRFRPSLAEIAKTLTAIEASWHFIDGELAFQGVPVRRLAEVQKSYAGPRPKLSDREFQVLKLLIADLQVSEIAAKLGVAPGRVSSLVTSLREKFDVRTNTGLVAAAMRAGIDD